MALGRSGIRALKREGDGATPLARIAPVAMFCRAAPARAVPWRRCRPGDGWCDDRVSAHYNTWIRQGTRASHEAMARTDGLYDWVVVTDHNQRPRRRGFGSAIFVHVARPALTPTEGCLAFGRELWQRGAVPFGCYLVGTHPRPVR